MIGRKKAQKAQEAISFELKAVRLVPVSVLTVFSCEMYGTE
jgi:hypothetical protein